MKYLNVNYHSCDICRISLTDYAWRCASCDFDICIACYKLCKDSCGIVDTSKTVEITKDANESIRDSDGEEEE